MEMWSGYQRSTEKGPLISFWVGLGVMQYSIGILESEMD